MRIRDIIERNESDDLQRAVRMYVAGYWHHKKGPGAFHSDVKKSIMDVFDRDMPKLDQIYELYRGITLKSWSELSDESDFRKNRIISFDGYLSTSLDRTMADHVIDGGIRLDKNDIGILFKITTRHGRRGVIVDNYHKYTSTQQEIILNRNSHFNVMSKIRKPWNSDVTLWKDGDVNTDPFTVVRDIEYWEVELQQI